MRALLALIVLILNVFAITSLLGARRGADTRLRWLAAIVLLPIAGALAWFISGRTRPR